MSLGEQYLCHQTAVPNTPSFLPHQKGTTGGQSYPKVAEVSLPFLSHPGRASTPTSFLKFLGPCKGNNLWPEVTRMRDGDTEERRCEDGFTDHHSWCPCQLSGKSCTQAFAVTGSVWTVWVQPVLGHGRGKSNEDGAHFLGAECQVMG